MSITPPHSDTEKFVDSVYNYSSATDPVDKNKFNFFFCKPTTAVFHGLIGNDSFWWWFCDSVILVFFKYDFDTLNLVLLLPKVLKTKFGWFIA